MPAATADEMLVAGLRAGERRALAKAITLVESARPEHQRRAQALIETLLPATGQSLRIGISGAPGVGKSTLIAALGLYLIAQGHRVAVLAVDPSSGLTGGSILGDKTRMAALAREPAAFIRPSPAGAALGGVAARTREVLLLCEAAGFDLIIVETLGVGQADTAVAQMTDCMVLLQLPIAGDALQALKKGIVESADLILITKADLLPEQADAAQQTLQGALALLRPATAHWQPPVLRLSTFDQEAMPALWAQIERHQAQMRQSGDFAARRRRQALDWMWHLIEMQLSADFQAHPGVLALLPDTLSAVSSGALSPSLAAQRLLAQARVR